MRKRPITVTVIAVLLALMGSAGIVSDLLHLKSAAAAHYEIIWIAIVHIIAIVAGAFMLMGHNWARWLAIAWMAFHVAISFGDGFLKPAMHILFLLLFAWLLFRADARAFFRSETRAA